MTDDDFKEIRERLNACARQLDLELERARAEREELLKTLETLETLNAIMEQELTKWKV